VPAEAADTTNPGVTLAPRPREVEGLLSPGVEAPRLHEEEVTKTMIAVGTSEPAAAPPPTGPKSHRSGDNYRRQSQHD